MELSLWIKIYGNCFVISKDKFFEARYELSHKLRSFRLCLRVYRRNLRKTWPADAHDREHRDQP